MNLRAKLAAVTLATGTLVGGTAALSLSAAQAAPPIEKVPVQPPISVITFPPVTTAPSVVSTLQPRTTIPPTTTTPPTTAPKCTDCDPDWTGSTAGGPVDPPVKATPAFTG
jgi:hypothetical protein